MIQLVYWIYCLGFWVSCLQQEFLVLINLGIEGGFQDINKINGDQCDVFLKSPIHAEGLIALQTANCTILYVAM